MANWVSDFLTRNPDMARLPIVKRAKHGIHFQQGSDIIAHFTGKPCHYLDGGTWEPVDTSLLPTSGGFYGSPHSDVLIHSDGRVAISGTNYQQYTSLPNSPIGLLDKDRIIREFVGGRQYLWMKEDGFKSEIVLDYLPDLTGAKAAAYFASIVGTLPTKYQMMNTVLIDANRNIFIYTGDNAAAKAWLTNAVYPVTIDPDFVANTNDTQVDGGGTSYSYARNHYGANYPTIPDYSVGQRVEAGPWYVCNTCFMLFNTSSIGNNSIQQVNLKLTFESLANNANFDVVIKKKVWSGGVANAYNSLLSAPNDDNIWHNSLNMVYGTQYSSGNLNILWVNKTGNTEYGLLSSDHINSIPPTSNQALYFGAADNSSPSFRPVLTVVYTSTVTTVAADTIETTSAKLKGTTIIV